MTSLGTLLIQRLDAALGNAISRQTGLVSTGRDFISQPGEAARPGSIDPSTVRDSRENVDRIIDHGRERGRTSANRGVTDTRTPLSARTAGHATPASSSQTVLGPAARTILNLLTDYTPGSAKVIGKRPLITTAPGSSTTALSNSELARNLSQAIRTSGLFYESHLKSLAQGQYRLSTIQREPQAQLLPQQPTHIRAFHAVVPSPVPQLPPHLLAARASHILASAGASTASSTGTTTPTASAAANPSTSTNVPPGPTPPASTAGPTANPSAVSSAEPPASAHAPGNLPTPGLDPATHQLVRQQLEILADQMIQWRGEAWPGAPMDWRIERHDKDQAAARQHDADNEGSWQSSLSLKLPHLGEVRARLHLDGPHLHLDLQTNQPASATLFREQTDTLATQLASRHLQLARVDVDTITDPP